MSYQHIGNLYNNQDILLFKECYALEKIHGTSARVSWRDNQLTFSSGGASHNRFKALFDLEDLTNKLIKLGHPEVSVYGEAYGGKVQKMSHVYGKELKFVAFEVKIGEYWLNVPNANDVVEKLGLEFVSFTQINTDIELIDKIRDEISIQAVRNGMGTDKEREGVVLRPLIEVTKNNGERVVAKHKGAKFAERANPPKVLFDPAKLKVLENAKEIAEEWVVPMRLEHVLQKLPNACGMEHTKEIINAMVEDVYREAKEEIVESKEVKTAICKKTAVLWKKHLEDKLKNS